MKTFLEYIKQGKHTYKVVAGVGIIGITFALIGMQNNSYAISVDGKIVGIVKTKEEAQAAYETVVTDVKSEAGVDIAVKETITVEHVNSKKAEIQTLEDLKTVLQESVSYQIEAYEILVDGEVRAVVDSQQTAEAVLAYIAKSHLPEGSKVELDVRTLAENQVVEDESEAPAQEIETQKKADATTQESEKQGDSSFTTSSSQTEIPVTTITNVEGAVVEVIEVQDALKEPEVKSKVQVASIEKNEQDEEVPENGQKIVRDLKVFDFNEEVIVRSTYVEAEDIVGEQEAIDILLSNTEEIVEYEMQEGDNIWDIAINHGTTMDHILEINPQIVDETRMQIGEMIKLEVPEPILSISTTEEATFKELIPADIEYVEFSDLYKDDTKTYQEGHDGLKEITVSVHKVNGKEVGRDLISEKVLKEAKTKVIAFGTKERPKKVTSDKGTSNKDNSSASVSGSNSGKFMHPLNGAGRLSSPYGSRWGTFHRAVDIAAPAGTPIYAAASGTIIYSGYNNGG
ncbi:MAG: G5 domain-containing protein, partial [Niameybacter sp.]